MAKVKRNLEAEIDKLRSDVIQLAGILNVTSTFVNALIKHTGISNETLNAAIAETSLASAERKHFQSQGARTTERNSGDGNMRISSAESDRNLEEQSDSSQDVGQERTDSGSNQHSGGSPTQTGSSQGASSKTAQGEVAAKSQPAPDADSK